MTTASELAISVADVITATVEAQQVLGSGVWIRASFSARIIDSHVEIDVLWSVLQKRGDKNFLLGAGHDAAGAIANALDNRKRKG